MAALEDPRDTPPRAAKRARIKALRRDLSRHESRRARAPRLSFGEPEIDLRLGGLGDRLHADESVRAQGARTSGGLSLAGLHEVVAHAYPDMGAATGFMAAVGARLQAARGGMLVWIARAHARAGAHDMGALYAPGLALSGLDPDRVLLVAAASDAEALWAAEEALAAGGTAGAVAELAASQAYGLKASRRLQLAAERHARPVFILPGHAGGDGTHAAGAGAAAAPPSAALTRFRIQAAPACREAGPGDTGCLGRARFAVHLDRVRGGAPFHIMLEWDHAARRFGVAAPVRDRAGMRPARPDARPLALTG